MKLGIGLPVDGYTPAGHDAVSALGADLVVLLNAHNVDDARGIIAANKGVTFVVRLDTPHINESANDYINRIRSHVEPYYQQGFPLIYYVLGNEPDVPGADVPTPYMPNQWRSAAPAYVSAFRGAFPGAALLSTPFSTEASNQATRDYLDLFDAISVHCYWQVDGDIGNPMFGAAWQHPVAAYGSEMTKLIFVTEVNNSAGTNPDQIVSWARSAEGSVAGMALFIADGQGQFAAMNVSADQCRAIRARYNGVVVYDLSYVSMSYPDYRDAVIGGSYNRTDSPLITEDAYHGLIIESKAANKNPRLALAFAQVETHMGIDENRGAINQFGGIKFAGQSGATDSGVAADTGGTYAAYATPQAYFHDFYAQLNNQYLGPFTAAGDLLGLVEKYTNGPGTGHNKIEQYDYFVGKYPAAPETNPAPPPVIVVPLPSPDPSNPAPLPSDFPVGISTAIPDLNARLAALVMSWVGQTRMGPGQLIDDGNGFVHPMADWCEAGGETAAAVITGIRLRFPSAWVHRQALEAAGAIDQDPNTAQPGHFDFWGPYADGFGHVTIRGTDGLTYGTSVVPDEWLGRPVNFYPNYGGHAEPEAVLIAAKSVDTPADPMNTLGVVNEDNTFRAFYFLRPNYDGHAPLIGNAMKAFWDANGPQLGVIRYGYPISVQDTEDGSWHDEVQVVREDGSKIDAQWCQRARLEFHPELGNKVLLGRIGAEWLQFWLSNGSQIPAVEPTTDNIDPQFAEYWKSHGALETLGLPLSVKCQLPGSSFAAQVFERAVLEFHPESADWPVQARLLGEEWIARIKNGQTLPVVSV